MNFRGDDGHVGEALSSLLKRAETAEASVAELRGVLTRAMSMLHGVTAAVEHALETPPSVSNTSGARGDSGIADEPCLTTTPARGPEEAGTFASEDAMRDTNAKTIVNTALAGELRAARNRSSDAQSKDHLECTGCGVWSPGAAKPSQWTEEAGRHYCYECSEKRRRRTNEPKGDALERAFWRFDALHKAHYRDCDPSLLGPMSEREAFKRAASELVRGSCPDKAIQVIQDATEVERDLLRKERDAWRDRARTFQRVLKGAGEVLRDMSVGAPKERAAIVADGVESCLEDHHENIDEKIAQRLSALPMSAWTRPETAIPSQEDDDEAIRRVASRLRLNGDSSRHVMLSDGVFAAVRVLDEKGESR